MRLNGSTLWKINKAGAKKSGADIRSTTQLNKVLKD